MTKIAITGPVSGTGTYTLNAPDTNSTLDFELPITGTHLASAQADGMPLGPGGDPVVESGSNSDGQWVRWADGTQYVWAEGLPVPGSSSAWGGIYIFSGGFWTLPASFISNAAAAASFNRSGGSQGWVVNSSYTASTEFNYSVASGGTPVDGTVSAMATGRWK